MEDNFEPLSFECLVHGKKNNDHAHGGIVGDLSDNTERSLVSSPHRRCKPPQSLGIKFGGCSSIACRDACVACVAANC